MRRYNGHWLALSLVGVRLVKSAEREWHMKDNRRAYLWFVTIVIVVMGLYQIFKSVLSTDADPEPAQDNRYTTY